MGQLTTIGYNQAFDVGQYLRKAYGPVSNDDVYIRSTNIYRTIETARGVFVGWNDAQVKHFKVIEMYHRTLEIS